MVKTKKSESYPVSHLTYKGYKAKQTLHLTAENEPLTFNVHIVTTIHPSILLILGDFTLLLYLLKRISQ